MAGVGVKTRLRLGPSNLLLNGSSASPSSLLSTSLNPSSPPPTPLSGSSSSLVPDAARLRAPERSRDVTVARAIRVVRLRRDASSEIRLEAKGPVRRRKVEERRVR